MPHMGLMGHIWTFMGIWGTHLYENLYGNMVFKSFVLTATVQPKAKKSDFITIKHIKLASLIFAFFLLYKLYSKIK